MPDCHIPFLSEEEQLLINSTAIKSKERRYSTASVIPRMSPQTQVDKTNHRRNQITSVSTLSFLWKKRRGSSSTVSSNESMEEEVEDKTRYKSAKARELEFLIFEQPHRTLRLSLTPQCAV
ncbi:hypothetical protein BDB01DRAFT_778082 [Pilobolus umbonatus]|nr:hypothetical protein BDB01DRAFT_778082 [Pilobolus umbonatus]